MDELLEKLTKGKRLAEDLQMIPRYLERMTIALERIAENGNKVLSPSKE